MTIYYIKVEECSIFSFQEFHPKIGNLVHEILLLPDLNIGPLNNKADATGPDSAFFWDKGTEVPSLSRDKLKILPRDGTGQDSQNSGRDGTRDKTGQSRKGRSKTGK